LQHIFQIATARQERINFNRNRKDARFGPAIVLFQMPDNAEPTPQFFVETHMVKLLAHWILSALCLLLVAHFVPGFFVSGFTTALIAAVVIGLVNGTIGVLLKIITFPLTIVTFGIFWLLINALMLKFAALFVPGFEVRGLWPAFWGGLILSVLNMLVRQILKKSDE
jgi:putative membrane protein